MRPGDRIGDYVIVAKLGEGGFGEAWKAENPELPGTCVCVKVPKSEDAVAALRREGRIQHALAHPGIVRVISLNTHTTPPYLVTELVEGESLRARLSRERRLPPAEAARILLAVLDALGAAHQSGLVHRDMKPENVLLSPGAAVKIADFGLGQAARDARSLQLSGGVSAAGGVVGTLDYMAPEQRRGEPCDARADLHACGVMLYEMLSGQAHPVVLPVRDAPPALSGLIERALAPAPGGRWRSAAEMAVALRSAVAGKPARETDPEARSPALPPPVARPPEQWEWETWSRPRSRGNRGMWGGAAALLLLAGLGLAASFVGSERSGRPATRGGDPEGSSRPEPGEGGKCLATWEGHTQAAVSVAFSLDGKLALSGSHDKTLKLWVVETGRAIATWEGHTAGVRSVAFSPDGNRALSGSFDKTLKLWVVETGRAIATWGGDGTEAAVTFSPDGKRALSGGDAYCLKLWDVESGRSIDTWKGHKGRVTSVAFSPDGKRALSGSDDMTLKLWDVESGRPIVTWEGHQGSIDSVAVSPDGTRALSGSWDNTIKLWDVQSGRALATWRGHTSTVYSVAFSPDGRRALSGSFDYTLKFWDVQSGRVIGTWRGHTSTVYTVTFSPDGKLALSGSLDNTLKLWAVPPAPR